MIDQLVTFGILVPGDLMHAKWFGVLAAFVALNTVMYVTLAIAKTLPKVYFVDWVPRRYQRSETRSIYPDRPA